MTAGVRGAAAVKLALIKWPHLQYLDFGNSKLHTLAVGQMIVATAAAAAPFQSQNCISTEGFVKSRIAPWPELFVLTSDLNHIPIFPCAGHASSHVAGHSMISRSVA